MTDPTLIQAAALLQQKMASLKDSGVEITPAHIEEFLRAKTGGKFGYGDYQKLGGVNLTNLLTSGIQGATFGFGDNILNQLDSKHEAGASVRATQQAFHEQHPYVDTAANLAGGILSGSSVGKAVKAIAGLAPAGGLAAKALAALGLAGDARTPAMAARQGLVAGGAFGAAEGAGNADAPDQSRLRGAAVGGGVGAVGGGVLGGAIGAGAAMLSPERHGTARIMDAIYQAGGLPAVKAKLAEMVAAGKGGEAMLADLSPHLRQALDYAANGSDNVLVPAVKAIDARQGGQAGRLLDDTRAHLNVSPDYTGEAAKAKANTSKVGEGYQALADANPHFDTSSLPLDKPLIGRLWERARLAGNLSSKGPLDDLIAKITASNPTLSKADAKVAAQQLSSMPVIGDDAAAAAARKTPDRPVTLDDLQQLRRSVKGMADAAWRKGNGALGTALGDIQDHVDGALEAGAPGMDAMNAKYKGAKDVERALDLGKDWWAKSDLSEFRRVVAKVAQVPEQLEKFRSGLASHLVEQLQNVKTNRDAAGELMKRSAAMDEKLETLFGDKATFDQFMEKAKAEAEMAKLATTVSGSQTARRLAARGIQPEHFALDAIQHGPAGMIREAFNAARHVATKKTADAMGPQLLTRGASSIDDLLTKLSTPTSLVSSPTMMGATGGLMSLFGH